MSKWKTSKLVRSLSFFILFAILLSFGYSTILKRPFIGSLSYFLFLEGGILLIIFSLVMSRSLRAKYGGREGLEGWARILEERDILVVASTLLLGSIIVSSLMAFL